MPIPHFNTTEFFINENELIISNNENEPIIYEAYTEYKRILDELNIIINNKCAEWKSMVINHYNNDDIMSIIIEDAQRYQNILSAFYDIIDSNNSIDTNDKDELLEYIAELIEECEESLKHINYIHDLLDVCIIINKRYDEWKRMVKNHYNNDDIMDDIIEDAKRYQNILVSFYDTVKSNDKKELLKCIAKIIEDCDKALNHINYKRILDELIDDIHNINNNNYDDLDETEYLQLCHNALFNCIDDVIKDTLINDKNELLEYITELNAECDKALIQ